VLIGTNLLCAPGPCVRRCKQRTPDSFGRNTFKNLVPTSTENTRSIRCKDESFNDLFVLRTIWSSRAFCRQNADVFRS
jgi:hypothetical protein